MERNRKQYIKLGSSAHNILEKEDEIVLDGQNQTTSSMSLSEEDIIEDSEEIYNEELNENTLQEEAQNIVNIIGTHRQTTIE